MSNDLKENKKSISSVIVWQVIGKIIVQGIAFFSARIFTRMLTSDDYGQYSSFMSWVAVVGIVIGLQADGTLRIARKRFDDKEYSGYCSSVLFLSLCVYLIIQFLLIIFQKPLGILLRFPSHIIPLIAIFSFTVFAVTFFSTKLEFDLKVEKKVLISVIVAVFGFLLSIYLVNGFNELKYSGRIIGTLIPSVIASVFIIIAVFRGGRDIVNKKHWGLCLNFSVPLMFHVGAAIILSQSDIIMLKHYVNESETGVYGVVYSLAIILSSLWDAFNRAWVPFYNDLKKRDDTVQIISKSKGYRFLFTSITMCFLLCAPEVFKFIAEESYWGGLTVIPLIACTYYIDFLWSFPENFEFYNENTKLISVATIISAVINIILNIILIPRFRIVGAAAATVASYFVCFTIHDICARFVIKRYEYNWGFYILGIIPVVICCFIYYLGMPYVLLRWLLALIIGAVALCRIIKQRSIF